jgi:hypothetical protein
VEEIIQVLWQASQNRRACRITMKGEPLVRVVHPYGVYRTSHNRIVLVCWQAMGFTKAGGKPGYRSMILQNIQEVEILEDEFEVDKDFNPSDAQYKEWVYHI